jgi:hypothetical protein
MNALQMPLQCRRRTLKRRSGVEAMNRLNCSDLNSTRERPDTAGAVDTTF